MGRVGLMFIPSLFGAGASLLNSWPGLRVAAGRLPYPLQRLLWHDVASAVAAARPSGGDSVPEQVVAEAPGTTAAVPSAVPPGRAPPAIA